MHQITRTLPITVAASDDLYLAIRAALVTRGSSLAEWCKANKINRQTAEKALKGLRHSRRADQLRARMIAELLADAAA